MKFPPDFHQNRNFYYLVMQNNKDAKQEKSLIFPITVGKIRLFIIKYNLVQSLGKHS